MQNLRFTRTWRNSKLTINISARDFEVRSRLAFVFDDESSLTRFEVGRHIDLPVVHGDVYPPCIGFRSESVLHLIGRLLHAMGDSFRSLLGFLRRRVGTILGRLKRLPRGAGNQTSNYHHYKKRLHSTYSIDPA